MILSAGAVVLRPFQERDLDPVIAMLGDPDLMQFVLDERTLTKDEAQRFVREHFASNDPLGFGTVTLSATDEAIGFAGLRECRYLGADDLEFGWLIAKPHQGRGYATGLGEHLIEYALAALRLPRILAACNPLNGASEHILHEKLRMRFERQVEPRPGFHRRVYSADARWSRHR